MILKQLTFTGSTADRTLTLLDETGTVATRGFLLQWKLFINIRKTNYGTEF